MSDAENDSNEPRPPKRRRIAKPFQPLSQPVETREAEESLNYSSKSQVASPALNNSIDSRFFKSSAGVIKKIKLLNFMCHSHFELKFNPRINFISGCNGSGKSAVQTGIVIGLGGVASKTNRSSKIDGLIKHGCNSGSITITLSNTGMNAYKPTEYGDEIQIIRTINSGSSSYRIYNKWGKLISNKKGELESILQRFRIQPNNPVSVLNQDMARNFLAANKAEAKYALFRKATLLDEAEDLLCKISGEIAEQEMLIDAKQKATQQVLEEIEKMSKKFELAEKLKEQKGKKFELENELMWSKVNDRRIEIQNLEEKCDEQLGIKKDYENKIVEIQTIIDEKNAQKEERARILEGLLTETKNKEEEKKTLTDECRKLRKAYDGKIMKMDEFRSKIRSKMSDRQQLKKSLDDVERDENELNQRKDEASVEIGTLKEKLANLDGQKRILEEEVARLKSTSDHYLQRIRFKKQAIEENRDQIGHLERHLQGLGKSNNLSGYSPWMATLVQRIDEAVRARRFSQPPRGPLGRYLKVKNEKWIYTIENNLNISWLSSFYVNNSKDRQTLYSIIDQVVTQGRKPTVHCSMFQDKSRDNMLPDIETNHPGYMNMFRALNISDTVVANFLIDSREIQKILLVDKKEDCRNFVSRDENIPRKCRLILDTDGDQYLPGFRVYANQERSRITRVLQKSVADQTRKLKEEIKLKKHLIETDGREIEDLQQQFQHSNEDVKKTSAEINSINMKVAEAKRRIQELKVVVEMETPSLQMQMEELREIEAEINGLENNKRLLAEEIKADKGTLETLKNQLNALNAADSFTRQSTFAEEKEKLEQEVNQLRVRIGQLSRQIEEQNTKINTLRSRINESQGRLNTEENTASQLSNGTDSQTIRSTAEIQDEIKEIEYFVQEAVKQLGSEEIDFERQYWDRKNSHKNFTESFKLSKTMHDDLKKMYAERKEVIIKIRDINTNVIIARFQDVLTCRNYKGRINFDHQKKKLDILMVPTDGGDMLMNTESLSGGEKSFSTVAFLMALWSNMELPFYSLDEYDVFMDAINRKAITKLLMSFATENSSKQFIFLTPLDVSLVETGRDVDVHR
ncbi:hypothetical protein V9T40_004109 [Parthenolecanium corni]|uniref:Rad50/SbcC-type AAA domain-containing protein n=1 Tax=Parthenolecanium corni TaxID=536013 RepID=A0AAN9Y2V3_9HEMI